MTAILLTGATGTLGRQVARALATETNVEARLMSRRSISSSSSHPTARWVQADLQSGTGLNAALRDIDVVIHCATGVLGNTEMEGARRLLAAAHAAGVSHIVYISIVGCDRIPLFYYRQKTAAEALIKASGIPWSILRATQFHALIDGLLRVVGRLPWVAPLPVDLCCQPVAESEVGRRLVDLALASPTRGIQEMGGPQVLSLGEMARTWFEIRHMCRAVLPLRLPGRIAAGYRRGENTCGLALPHGEVTWEQWVRQTYQGASGEAASPGPLRAVHL